MALSAGAVAGIAIGCAIFSLFVGLLTGPRLIRRILGTNKPEWYWPVPSMIAEEIHETLPRLDYPRHNAVKWLPWVDIIALECRIDQFIMFWFHCNGELLYDVPFDPDKLTRLAGGDFDDWSALAGLTHFKGRCEILCHFVARALWQRMIPDGDPSTSLLPTDMLSLWQHLRNKQIPPEGSTERTEEAERLNTLMRQQWRYLTVLWGSDRYPRLRTRPDNELWSGDPYIERKGNWGIRVPNGPTTLEEQLMHKDDARMPKVIALEEAIKDALAPLCRKTKHDDSGLFGFECPEFKQRLREITTRAADIALVAFGQPHPHELYWPEETIRPGVCVLRDREGKDEPGHLIMFGVRHRNFIPGCEERQRKWGVETKKEDRRWQRIQTVIDCRPRYHDTEYLDKYWGEYRMTEDYLNQAIANHKAENGEHAEETESLKKRRAELEFMKTRGLEYFSKQSPGVYDGWEPAHLW